MSHQDKPQFYSKSVIYEVRDNIGWITLNRPEKLNAVNDDMLNELDEAFAAAEPDLDAKVIVIKGAGRAFSVGEDLSGVDTAEINRLTPGADVSMKETMEAARRWNRRLEYISNVVKPTIAQVHGYCLGFGCSLSMVCDMTIASDDAVFGDPSMRIGALPAMPLWPWLIGLNRTKELLYTGKYLNATEAEEWGLITQVVPADKLEEEVNTLARGMTLLHSDGLAAAKDSIRAVMEARGVGGAWRLTDEMLMLMQRRDFSSDEFDFWDLRDNEGLKAAIEERDAPFQGF